MKTDRKEKDDIMPCRENFRNGIGKDLRIIDCLDTALAC